jgi:dolichol-phosphate mannosyltransferase
MGKPDVLVSAIALLHDHATILPAFVAELCGVLADGYANYEVVLVDGGAPAETVAAARGLLAAHPCVRLIRLSRETPDETALLAGLDAAIGDFVVVLDPDLDPPAEIPAMVDRCRVGAEVVLGVDPGYQPGGPLYKLFRSGFGAVLRRMMGIELPPGPSGFRVLSRAAVNALTRVRQRRRYFALVVREIGLTTAEHRYRRASRSGRAPGVNFFRAARTGLSVLVHNSLLPLRLVSLLGLFGSLISFAYSLYVVAVYLFKPDVMPGWTTMSLQVSGLFVLVFVMLALIGEYLVRVLEESSDRPLYHVRDEHASAVTLTDPARRNVSDRSEE